MKNLTEAVFILDRSGSMSGEENSSKRYGYGSIKKLVEEQKAKGRDFVFMGAKTLTKILIHANKFLRENF